MLTVSQSALLSCILQGGQGWTLMICTIITLLSNRHRDSLLGVCMYIQCQVRYRKLHYTTLKIQVLVKRCSICFPTKMGIEGSVHCITRSCRECASSIRISRLPLSVADECCFRLPSAVPEKCKQLYQNAFVVAQFYEI